MDVINVLLEISIYSAVIFTVLMLLKRMFRDRMSPVLNYAVWALLIIRLMLPVTIDSSIKLFVIPDTQVQAAQVANAAEGTPESTVLPYSGYNAGAQNYQPELPQEKSEAVPENTARTVTGNKTAKAWTVGDILITVWFSGIGASITYIAFSYVMLRRRIRRDGFPAAERVQTLFEKCKLELGIKGPVKVLSVYSLGSPAIFIPAAVLLPAELLVSMDDTQIEYALRHELIHYRHKDHIVCTLLLLLQAVYWFNPFVWLGFRQMRSDMEVACDSAVVRPLESGEKCRYAGMIVSMFSEPRHKRMVLGMAQGATKKAAENRVRGIFMNVRSGISAKLISAVVASLLLITCFTTACQPTPEEPVVVGKNEGVMESAIGRQSGEQQDPYDAPELLQMDVDGLPEGYTITIDAEVEVSDQTAWPVYTVAPGTITQQQADAARLTLLGDTVLYKPGEQRSRAEIQKSIDHYEEELRGSENYPDLIDAYQKILKGLYIEYESTPEDLVLEEADTDFMFMESQVQPELYGGEKVEIDEQSYRYEWTDEARQKAKDAGCENINGVCWMDTGRKMVFSVANGSWSYGLQFRVAEGNMVEDPGVSYTLDEAIGKGDELLKAMGLDFTLVEAQTQNDLEMNDADEMIETGLKFHILTYKRRIEGVPQNNIISCIDQNLGDDYRSPIPAQETITICLDDYGVYSFSWSDPMDVVALENEGVALMPFDEISQRIASQLKIQTVWDETVDETEEQWIESRRLGVNKLVLSYMMVAKANDMSSYYLIPIWDVCGDLIYHYTDDYPTGQSNTWVLDENNERYPWCSRYETPGNKSILTINAVDGSVIPRHRWY